MNTMETLKFKTNIKCGACVATVKPHLDEQTAIKNWQVDLESPERFLTVVSEGYSPAQVRDVIEKAGYQAESI